MEIDTSARRGSSATGHVLSVFVLAMLVQIPIVTAATGDRFPGGLMFKPGVGEVFAIAPLLNTSVSIDVTGVVARTEVRQLGLTLLMFIRRRTA